MGFKNYRSRIPKEVKLASMNGYGSSHKLLTGYEVSLVAGIDYEDWKLMVKQKIVPETSFWVNDRPYWQRELIYSWIEAGMPPAYEWRRK